MSTAHPCSPRQGVDQVAGGFDLLARARVEEDARAVAADDHPVGKGLAEVVLQLARVETIDQRARVLVLAGVDLQAPVVVHRRQLTRGG